jgi:DNA polymerase-3 subunit gamma/tau
MEYLVLSRKYRPRAFEDVVGQDHITHTLQKAVESGRVAQAYIFSGTRGTGKTTMARILAKALNCDKGPTAHPCNKCTICAAVDTGQDVDVVEIDGASHNSVEDVRELRSNANYTPARARYKIYYIDEVHMLSAAAFNALLKTLEEPPAHVKFIFSTTEPHKIPLTIQSRCQRFDFRNISADEILKRLTWIAGEEGIKIDDGALAIIARFASGSMRDAESLFDQVASFAGKKVTAADVEKVLGVVPAEAMSRLVTALAAGDTPKALEAVDAVLSGGTSARQFVAEFIDHLRDCLVAKTCGADSKLLVRSAGEREMLSGDAGKWSPEAFIYAMQLLGETYARMARSPQTRGLLDVGIVKLGRVEDFLLLADLVSSMRGGTVEPGPTAGEGKERPFDRPAATRTARSGGAIPGGEMQGGVPPSGVRAAGVPAAGVPPEGVPPAVYEALIETARSKGPLVAKTLEQHATITLREGKLSISLPVNFGPHKAALEKEELRAAIEEAVSRAAESQVRLEVTCNAANGVPPGGVPPNGHAAATPESRKRALKEQALSDPAVRRVMELFDGTLVDVEE